MDIRNLQSRWVPPKVIGQKYQDPWSRKQKTAHGLFYSTGVCTFDPGYFSTGSCESSITYIDGAKGVLLYRGCASVVL